jgi:hypothetical protein
MKDKAWIWIVLLLVVMMGASIAKVIVAVRNPPATVPLENGR